jgi:PhnB protein
VGLNVIVDEVVIDRKRGDVWNAALAGLEVRMGDAWILITPSIERELFRAFFYVCVDDAAAAYGRALAAGAFSVELPLDRPYGDRRAMVCDPFGNVFQIAPQLSGR